MKTFLSMLVCFIFAVAPGMTDISSAGEAAIKLSLDDTITAGDTAVLTITVMNATGKPITDYEGTVYIKTTDPVLNKTIPGSYTFSKNDGGVHAMEIVFRSLSITSDPEKLIDFEVSGKGLDVLLKKISTYEQLQEAGQTVDDEGRDIEKLLAETEAQIAAKSTLATLHEVVVMEETSGVTAKSNILVFPAKKTPLFLRDADIREAFDIIATTAGVNIAMSETVPSLFSISCRNMFVLDIFKAVLKSRNLVYERTGELLYVFPRPSEKMITKDFNLPYVMSTRTGKGEISATAGSGTVKSGTSSVNTTTNTDFWQMIANNLSKMLSENGTYVINDMASLIRVTDYEENVEKIGEFLKEIEKTSLRQVAIKAQIMEINLNKGRTLGVDWATVMGNDGTQGFMGFMRKQLKGNYQTQTDITDAAGQVIGQSIGYNPVNLSEYDTQNFKIGIFDYGNFTAVLETLEEEGDVKMLSAPTITTLNNQTAIIKTTIEDVAWEKTIRNDDEGNPVEVTYSSDDISTGIIMDVTPFVDNNDRITLSIHPSISEKIGTSTPPGDTANSKPILSIREMNSVVQLKQGETLVMGGLIKEMTYQDDSGLPYLKDIPVLGNLFKTETTEKDRVELVITVTPYVIDKYQEDRKKLEKDLSTEKMTKKVIPAVPVFPDKETPAADGEKSMDEKEAGKPILEQMTP